MTEKCSFITLVGATNVGKSTLVNALVGSKVSIVTYKPQTTRNNISGIHTTESSQIIFIDTPGIHKPHHKLGAFMTKEAINTLRTVDLILFMVDSTKSYGPGDEFIINEPFHPSPDGCL